MGVTYVTPIQIFVALGLVRQLDADLTRSTPVGISLQFAGTTMKQQRILGIVDMHHRGRRACKIDSMCSRQSQHGFFLASTVVFSLFVNSINVC